MITGRKSQKELLKHYPPKKGKRIWIHAASLGEYEMAVPLIEEMLNQHSNLEFIISFFSPSGYKNAKILEHCTKIYLPFDYKKSADKFIKYLNPDLAIFVKYEFWPNFINACHKNNIPLWYWNFLLRENHFILKPWSKFWQKALQSVAGFYCQDANTFELSKQIQLPNIKILGDIRYLRTQKIQTQVTDIPQKIKTFTQGKSTLILGSSWENEETALFHYLQRNAINSNQCIIIAPHDIGEEHIQIIEKTFKSFEIERYSQFKNHSSTKILIIDSIGLLSRLYAFSEIAVIGGAFGRGLHNIIEASAAGVPVIFGPNTSKFPEAQDFVAANIGFQANSIEEMSNLIAKLWNLNQQELTLLKGLTKDFFNKKIPQIETAVKEILA